MSAEPQRIILAIGLPGAGKSTWFRSQGITPLSSDGMRLLLADDENDQSIHIEVFEALRYLLVKRLEIGRPATYIDATNLLKIHRAAYFELAREKGCRVEAVWFDVPLEACLERNRNRERQVPEDVMREMARTLEPPTEEEGFARVTRVAIPAT